MSLSKQSASQKLIHEQGINIERDNYFGRLIAGYLGRRFGRDLELPVLDAGAGDGSLLLELGRLHKKSSLVGVDLVGRREPLVLESDLAKLPFAADKFGTVFCTEVLEHLDDETLEKALGEFGRVLKSGGKLICSFPFDEDLSRNSFVCPDCGHGFHRYGHVRSWHEKGVVQEMFEGAGFEVESLEILPLGAVAKFGFLRWLAPIFNRLDNPAGLRKRALIVAVPSD